MARLALLHQLALRPWDVEDGPQFAVSPALLVVTRDSVPHVFAEDKDRGVHIERHRVVLEGTVAAPRGFPVAPDIQRPVGHCHAMDLAPVILEYHLALSSGRRPANSRKGVASTEDRHVVNRLGAEMACVVCVPSLDPSCGTGLEGDLLHLVGKATTGRGVDLLSR